MNDSQLKLGHWKYCRFFFCLVQLVMTIFQASDVIRRNKCILAHAWKLEDVIVTVAFSEVVYSFCTILCGMFYKTRVL